MTRTHVQRGTSLANDIALLKTSLLLFDGQAYFSSWMRIETYHSHEPNVLVCLCVSFNNCWSLLCKYRSYPKITRSACEFRSEPFTIVHREFICRSWDSQEWNKLLILLIHNNVISQIIVSFVNLCWTIMNDFHVHRDFTNRMIFEIKRITTMYLQNNRPFECDQQM